MIKKINKQRIKTDPIYFVENIVGQKLTNFQKEWFNILQTKKRVTFMAFRSSGKTRQLFVHYFLWKAIVNPATQYLILSKTLPQAKEVLKDIRLTILTNFYLKSLVPKNRKQTWSTTELEIMNHSRILSKAYNDNVRGLHVDGLGCDEMGEYEDHEILKKAVLPTIRAKRGFFIGVGTPKSELDLLHEIERDPGFKSITFGRYPAEGEKGNLFEIRYPDTKIVHGEGVVEIRDEKTDDLIESYSNLAWSQEFLLKPVSMKDKLFPDHLIQACLDATIPFQHEVKNMRQYFMGVDFAMSAASGADFTVVTILEKPLDSKRLKLVYMARWRGLDYIMQKQKIQELSEKYQVTKVLGDESSFGKTFIYDLKVAGVPIDGYKFTGGYAGRGKEELIKALRDQFEKKGFKSKTVRFEGLGKHDDCVISLALASFIARNVTMAVFSAIKGSKRGNDSFFAVSK
jgi:hypothetical protein